jgi:glycoside/pentoside/hexuronide:cation symporter, GPH family
MKIEKILYSIGFFSVFLSSLTISSNIQSYYIEKKAINPLDIGIIWSISSIINGIFQPLIGYYSDKTKTKFFNCSKRFTWILFFSIPWLLSFYLLFNPINIGINVKYYFFIMINIWNLSDSVMIVNWFALLSEIFEKEDIKDMALLKYIFLTFGGLSGKTFPILLTNNFENNFFLTKLVLPIMSLLPILGYFLKIKNKPMTIEERKDEHKNISFFENIKLCFKLQSYRIFFFSQILFYGSNIITTIFLPLYLKYITGIKKNITIINHTLPPVLQMSIIISSFFLFGIIFSGITRIIISKIGTIRSYQFSCFSYSLLIVLSHLFIPTGFFPRLITNMILGSLTSGLRIIPDMFLNEIIVEDEYVNNIGRREGVFIGVNGICVQMGAMLQGSVSGFILSTFKYVPGKYDQSELAITGITVGYVFIPSIFNFLMGFLYYFFIINVKKNKIN